MSTPPRPGARPSIRVGQDLSDDLAVIMTATGGTLSDAVRDAVRHLADAYRRAWDYGDVPKGTAPTILGAYYAEAPGQAPVPHTSDATSTPHVRPADTAPGRPVSATSDNGRSPVSDVRHDRPTPVGHR